MRVRGRETEESFERKFRAKSDTKRVVRSFFGSPCSHLQKLPLEIFHGESCSTYAIMCRSDARQTACRLTPPQRNIVVHLHASSSVVVITATEEITHVDVFLGLLLLGLLLLRSGRVISSTAGSGRASTAATPSANIGQKLGNVLSLEGLGKEAGPVALNGVSASLDDLAEFFFL